jgi:sugar/nucleoside kinase (ribokinase family)
MDHFYEVDRIVSDGERLVTGYTPAPGGSAANAIYGLAKLGINTGFIGEIMARFAISEIGGRKGLPSLNQLSQAYYEFSI